MPQESLPGINIDSYCLSNPSNEQEVESHRSKLLAEGSNTPPYPKAISDAMLTEAEVLLASRELLIYISNMRQKAEAKCLVDVRSTNATKPSAERRQ